MEKYFDINESGFSIRCKLYYNKDLHNLPHIVVATYGFGGNKDNKAIEKFAERIWLLEDGTIRDFPCGYQKYRSILEHEAAAKPAPVVEAKPKKEKPKGGTKESEKRVRRLEREIEKQEAAIAELDARIEAAAADYQELTRLLGEKETAENDLMELMEQWEAAQTD